MDVRLSPEQRALRDAAAQLVDRSGPRSVADLDDSERSAKLNASVVAAGWRELRTPAEDGTPVASAVEAALLAEELSRGLADVAFLGPVLATELRRLAGSAQPLAQETVALGAGLRGAARSDALAGAVAIDSAGSTGALVLVPLQRGWSLGRASLLTEADEAVDLTRSVAPVGEWEPLDGVLDDADLRRWTALALALTSAELVGTMRGALRLAVDYAQTRKQYGAVIGSYQALQHLLADAHVAMEGSRSVALHAAWAVDALAPDEAVTAAAIAKAYCARAARSVCETAIQVHGGIGNTWECLAHVFLRRALLSSDVLGGEQASLARVLDAYRMGATHGLR